MKKNRLLSAAFAVVMVISAMAMGVTAYAEGNTGDTTVKLTVAPKNSYTMTIPTETTMNSDGSATALTNGLNVKGANMQAGVKVSMSGANSWNMKAEGNTSEIGFGVYESAASEDSVTTVYFSRKSVEANNGTGTTKNLYVKADAADIEEAQPGNYTGTITFTAELDRVRVSSADLLNGMEIESNDLVLCAGDTWENAVAVNEGKKLVLSLGGDTFELTLMKAEIAGTVNVALALDDSPVILLYNLDPSVAATTALKITDSVPENVWIKVIY